MDRDPYSRSDPLWTANIYCAGRLDEVIGRCVAPFWQRAKEQAAGGAGYLWMMRYRRRGEHLKLRMHGRDDSGALRDSLQSAVHDYLAALVPAPDGAGAATGDDPRAPAIDVDDEAAEPQPDRTLLWTRYRRSAVVFGSEQILDDDRYAAIITRALGHGCEQVLVAAAAAAARGDISFAARQTTLIRAAISGLAEMGWSTAERARYLIYHRNWLLRYVLARSGHGVEHATALLARFAGNIEMMGASRQAVAGAVATAWNKAGVPGEQDTADTWPNALRALARHATECDRDRGGGLFPFTPRPSFAPVFKVLHGTANQLGIKPLDESFVFHLLFQLYAPGEPSAFTADPMADAAFDAPASDRTESV